MKLKSRKYKILPLMLALLAGCTMVLPANAGSSELVTDSSSYETEFSAALWKNKDEDVLIQDGVIVFPEESTELTGLITKTAAKRSDMHENLMQAQATIEFTSLPKEEAFVLALGLASVESLTGEEGNIEITFTNHDGVQVAVKAYEDEGDATVLMEEKACGNLGTQIKVHAIISNEQMLTLSIDGKEFYEGELPVSGEGRAGFLQTGSCGARVSDVEIVSYRYDNPENINATEDFESGSFNINAWTSKMVIPCYSYFPTGTNIVEEAGNHVFRFNNSGCAYIGTKYQYSNFELTFDVPYLQRTHVQDEEGNIITPKCENFAVSIGGEASDYTDTGYTNASDLIIFSGNSTITSWHTKKAADAAAVGYPYFSADCDKGFSVKISVIDSVITVGLKWIEEEAFTDVFTYQVTRENPLGYVHIWTTASVANLAIDNLKIVNKDMEPVLTEVEFQDGIIKRPKDFSYESMERIYEENEKNEFNWFWILGIVMTLCVIAVLAAIVLNKRKAGDVHDKNEI